MRYAAVLLAASALAAMACAGCSKKPADQRPSSRDAASGTELGGTPLQAVQDYIRLLKAGQGAKAVSTYWAWDRVLSVIFGADLRQQSPQDVAQIEGLLTAFMTRSATDPTTVDDAAKATFDGFAQVQEPDGTTRVAYTVRTAKGNVFQNSMILKEARGRWRVVDMQIVGKFTSASLRNLYLLARQKRDLTPLQWAREALAPPPTPK